MSSHITDITDILVAGGKYVFSNTIQSGGAAHNLTSKTVTATIRRESDPGSSIDGTLEDITVTIVTAVDGTVTWTLTSTMSGLLTVPSDINKTENYLIQYHVVEDNYFPNVLRFKARRSID